MSMQSPILNDLYVFMYYFFQICLFIFMRNTVRKSRLPSGGAPTWIFFMARRYMYFFFLASIFRRHTFRCSDSKNRVQIFMKRPAILVWMDRFWEKRPAAENQSVQRKLSGIAWSRIVCSSLSTNLTNRPRYKTKLRYGNLLERGCRPNRSRYCILKIK